MTEDAKWNTNPETESTLQKMARGMSQEEAAPEWKMPGDTPGPLNTKGTPEEEIEEGDTHQLTEDKMNERVSGMTRETGAGGDLHQHIQGRINQLAREIFEED